ncbi:MAG TPA: thiamine ABC transporter substrate-binding protein, partial [Spirochaetales bacterium]|nr:thiamine ABC transporter substrate-binding protein [Spirochaetales bacterium]
DGGQVLSRAVDERDNPQADIILGVDNNLAQRAVDSGILRAYKPKGWETVSSDKVLDAQWHLTPYDWGAFAIIWDSDKLANPPASLEDLTKPEFAKKLILMDPRTSTPGLGFLAWTKAMYGEQMADYWKRLAPSVLTMAPGWDMGYGLFTKGEAPLVLSYTTSPAYHAEYETGGRYKALIFAEGHPIQIEGVGILKGAPHRKAAEAFMDFILSDAFQDAIPLTNWMYPVVERALPASYQWAPKPTTLIKQDPAQLAGSVESALDALGGR